MPSAALLCATYLRPEMLHIHRHITGLRQYRPVVIAQKTEGDWPVETLRVVPRSFWRFWARSREKQTGRPWQISNAEAHRIRAVLREQDCSLLHVFFGNVAVHYLPLLRDCPVPVIVSFHGSDVAGGMASAAYQPAVRELFDRAALVPCRSEQLADQVEALGCPREKIRLMRTVLPEIAFVNRQPPSDGAWRIVQAARLVPKKGLATALRAFARFAEQYPWSTFTIAGEGPMEDELRRLAAELNVDDRVQFSGFLAQDPLRDLCATSHIFLHPSETVNGDVEGVPNAMLEAMASGLPVVATRHGGIPEVITDHVNGLLTAEKDVGGVTAALTSLATDPALYQKISTSSAAQVHDQFSPARQIAAVENLYEEVTNRKNSKGN